MIAVASIYGVDLMMDNVNACRRRLYDIWNDEYEAICKNETDDECRKAVKFILSRNIVCGNALSLKVVNENGEDTDEPIVFSEWSFVMGTKMQRRDYRFDKLLAGEYEVTAKKKQCKTEPIAQLSLINIPEEKSSDEGEFLKSYITDYRRVQDYGE